jgi:competence protein ComEA
MTLRPIVRALIVPVLGLELENLGAAAQDAKDADARPSVNTSPVEELARAIGLRRAADVVAHRRAHGPFRRLEDLMEVRGIGERTWTRIASRVRL